MTRLMAAFFNRDGLKVIPVSEVVNVPGPVQHIPPPVSALPACAGLQTGDLVLELVPVHSVTGPDRETGCQGG